MTTLLHFMYMQNTWVAIDNFLTSCEPTIKCRREDISPKPTVLRCVLKTWKEMELLIVANFLAHIGEDCKIAALAFNPR